MIRPSAAAMLILFGVHATTVGAAAVPDATSKKDGNLRGLVNKIVSPLKNQIYQPTKTIDPDYNPTRPVPDYNPTRPVPDYNPTRPVPDYNPTRPAQISF